MATTLRSWSLLSYESTGYTADEAAHMLRMTILQFNEKVRAEAERVAVQAEQEAAKTRPQQTALPLKRAS